MMLLWCEGGELMGRYAGVTIPLYPTKEQEELISQSLGSNRFVWNQMLGMLTERHKNNKSLKMLKNNELQLLLKPLKIEYPFLTDCDSHILQVTCKNLSEAFKEFYRGTNGYPSFKKKGGIFRDGYTSNAKIRKMGRNFVNLPKLKAVRCRNKTAIPVDKIVRHTVSRSSAGKYFLSIVYKRESQALEKTGKVIGLDFGVKDLVIGSEDGIRFKTRKFLNYEKKLKVWQKKHARRRLRAKQQGRDLDDCKNVEKARVMAVKYHEKIANCRADYLHKISRKLVEDYDVIVIEDLKVSNMVKNRKLSRSITNQSWRELRTFLTYKCEWYGKQLIVVNPCYTSQVCSSCGVNGGKKPLNIREWTCKNCGVTHDRDINAAINIKNVGLGASLSK